nr:10454_t:CDS:2 [Entrophospora candida]
MNLKQFLDGYSLPLILDGGMATQLEKIYNKDLYKTNLWSSIYLYQDPDSIKKSHLDYLKAGADIISTCSYQAFLDGFIKQGFTEQQSVGIIQKSVDIAVNARDIFWKEYQNQIISNSKNPHTYNKNKSRIKPLIALSMGPYGAILCDGSEYKGDYVDQTATREQIESFHKNQLNLFKDKFNKIDLIAFETIPSLVEAKIICEVIMKEHIDMMCWISFSCRNEEQICHGESFLESFIEICKYDFVIGVGVNCTNPKFINSLIDNLRNKAKKISLEYEKKWIVCYPDGGNSWDEGKHKWSENTGLKIKEFVDLAKSWIEKCENRIILGGCCNTTPEHISSMRKVIFEDCI